MELVEEINRLLDEKHDRLVLALVPKPIFFAIDNAETGRLPPNPKTDGILYGLHEPEKERLTLFVCADKDGTKQLDFSVWHCNSLL
jgi:hypothetical protein